MNHPTLETRLALPNFPHSRDWQSLHPAPPVLSASELLSKALRALAFSVVEKRARKDNRAAQLLAELRIESESGAGLALATLCNRFPFAFAALSKRLVSLHSDNRKRAVFVGPVRPASLASAFPLFVWRAAHKACDKALRKMSKGTTLETFDATGWSEAVCPDNETENQLAETLACSTIRLKAGALRDAIRAKVADRGTRGATKSGLAHLRRVDAWESRALALARGEESKPLPVLSVLPSSSVAVSETLAIYTLAGRPVAHDGRGGASGERKARAVFASDLHASGFNALRKLKAFLGKPVRTPSPVRILSDEVKRENRRLSARAFAMQYACELSAMDAKPVPAPRASLRPVRYVRDYTMGGKGLSFA